MKKSKILVLVFVMIMVLTLGLTACGNKDDGPKAKTITTVVDGKETTITIDNKDFVLVDAVKDGYMFKGWFTDEGLTETFNFETFNTGKKGSIKIYAKFEQITYTKVDAVEATCTKAGNIEYYICNDGKKYIKDGDKYTVVTDENTLVASKVQLVEVAEVPAKMDVDGVKKHWKCPKCNKLYKTNEASEDNIATAEYLRIPALEKRTITFNSNGGSTVADIVVVKGSVVTSPQNPTKKGHTFVGWFSDEALNTAYTFGKLNNDTNLYAKWKANTYKVSFVSDDVTMLVVDLVYGENYGELPTPDAKAGFRFEGWYTDKVAGEKVLDNLDYLLAEDCTLYARWTEKTDPTLNFNSQAYEITYNAKAFDITDKYYTTNSDSAVAVSYYKGTTKLDSAPKDAGTYSIKIAVTETNNFKAKEQSVQLFINKVVLTSTSNIAEKFYHNKDGSATFSIELYKTDFESMVEDSIVVEVTTPSGNIGEYKNVTIINELQNYDVSQLKFDITLEHNYQLKITNMPTLNSTGLADNRCLVCDNIKDEGVVIPSINDGVNTNKYKYLGSVEKAPTMDAVGYIILNIGRYERFELPKLTDANYIKKEIHGGNLVDSSLVSYYIGGETNKILVAQDVEVPITEVSDTYGLMYKKSDKPGKVVLFDYRGNAKQIRIPSTVFSGAQFQVEITDGVNPLFTKANVNGLESIVVPEVMPNGDVFEANSDAEPYNINLYYTFTNPRQEIEEYYTYGVYGLSTYYFSENMPIPTDVTKPLPYTTSYSWHYSNTGVAVSWGTFVKVDVTNGAVLYRYDDTTKTAYLVKATITAPNTDLSIYDNRTFVKGKIADKFIFCADAFDDCKQNLRTLTLAINSKISGSPNYEAPVIEEFAFSGCSNLTTISFNKESLIVKDNAFSNCPKLKKIILTNVGDADSVTFSGDSSSVFAGANANLKIYLRKVPVTTLDAWKAVKTSVAGSKMYLYSVESPTLEVPAGFDGYYKNAVTDELW